MQLDLTKYYQTISSIRQRCPYVGLPEEIWSAFEKELRLRLSWNTNSLEGNTLTLEETVDALEYDEVRSGHTYSEYTEAKTAYEANCELSFRKTQEINIDLIHRINAIIMRTGGEFRSRQVYVGSIAEVAWMPPRPEEIPGQMEAWCQRAAGAFRDKSDAEPTLFRDKSDEAGHIESCEETRKAGLADPAAIISTVAGLHMQFEMIHPFADGNGRTGRFIMNQMLLNAGLMPAIILNQSKYRQAFRIYERSQDTALMEYCIAAGVVKTYEILENICRKLR